ncbi:MAG: hypothetical protein ABJC13_25805 [Acidobacteriota bacterium]
MKKKLKKLVLAKETIRAFAAPWLTGINGDFGDLTDPAATEGATCDTCTCMTFCCASRIRNCFSPPPGG